MVNYMVINVFNGSLMGFNGEQSNGQFVVN